MVNRGSVALPEQAPWLKEFIAEVGGFPLAPLNDLPDALTHSLKFMLSEHEYELPERTTRASLRELAASDREFERERRRKTAICPELDAVDGHNYNSPYGMSDNDPWEDW